MSESAPFRRPVPFTQILDETLRWSRRHLKSILVPAATPVAIIAGLVPLAQGAWIRSLAPMMSERGTVHDPFMMFRGMVPFALLVLVFMAVHFFAYVAMIVAACQAVAGEPVAMGQAWRFAFRGRVFGTLILSALIIFVGSLCCVLPGLYVALLFSMILPVMVFESRHGWDALSRSRALAEHNPSGTFTADPRVKIFVMGFVGYLVGYAISIIVQLPLIILQQILTMRMMGSGEAVDPMQVMAKMAWIQAPSQVIGTFVQMIMQLYISFGTALLYVDLKLRREGGDLEAEVAEMAAAPLPPGEGPA